MSRRTKIPSDMLRQAQLPELCTDLHDSIPALLLLESGLSGSTSLPKRPQIVPSCCCLTTPIRGPNNQPANANHWAGPLECFGSQIHSRSPGKQKDHRGDKRTCVPFEPSTRSSRRSSSLSWYGSNSTQEKEHLFPIVRFAGGLPGQYLQAQ